jgi:hypothetical protein
MGLLRRRFLSLLSAQNSATWLALMGATPVWAADAPQEASRPGPPATPPATRTTQASPSDYLNKLPTLAPGDTLVLAPGFYGVDALGLDTASVPGLPLFNLHGTQQAPITITGDPALPRPVLLGRRTHNTIRLANTSHVVLRHLHVDGRSRGGFGVAAQGLAHHITIEDCVFVGQDGNQQVVAISSTGSPTWGWVIRGNLIVGAGTGMYLGNSDGSSPFVSGLIEGNVVRDTIGYNIQIKHQVPWGPTPAGMPTEASTTVIRHNVFHKSASSSRGGLARPCLLVGDGPGHGPGSRNRFAIHSNFFYQNPAASLFQGEGRFALYNNVMVTDGTAIRVQPHNGAVRDVCIANNTVVAGDSGLVLLGQRGEPMADDAVRHVVQGNVVVGATGIQVLSAHAHVLQNVQGSRAQWAAVCAVGAWGAARDAPSDGPTGFGGAGLPELGALSLFPTHDALWLDALQGDPLQGWEGADLDFNGQPRDARARGAYSGWGRNPGWALALDFKR